MLRSAPGCILGEPHLGVEEVARVLVLHQLQLDHVGFGDLLDVGRETERFCDEVLSFVVPEDLLAVLAFGGLDGQSGNAPANREVVPDLLEGVDVRVADLEEVLRDLRRRLGVVGDLVYPVDPCWRIEPVIGLDLAGLAGHLLLGRRVGVDQVDDRLPGALRHLGLRRRAAAGAGDDDAAQDQTQKCALDAHAYSPCAERECTRSACTMLAVVAVYWHIVRQVSSIFNWGY